MSKEFFFWMMIGAIVREQKPGLLWIAGQKRLTGLC